MAPVLPLGRDEGHFLVEALAQHLADLACLVDGAPRATQFDSPAPPAISVHDYSKRIFQRFKCSPECFLHALIYIERFTKLQPTCPLRSTNVHRLLITAVVIGAKFFDDDSFHNSDYAKVGGIKCTLMNIMEAQFLKDVGWDVYVSAEEYAACLSRVNAWRCVQAPAAPDTPVEPPKVCDRQRCVELAPETAPTAPAAPDTPVEPPKVCDRQRHVEHAPETAPIVSLEDVSAIAHVAESEAPAEFIFRPLAVCPGAEVPARNARARKLRRHKKFRDARAGSGHLGAACDRPPLQCVRA